ncbi:MULTISPECIES: heme exporter protein CcmD [Xanthomonas translucens group]|uniref:Heme exporter protein D n=4 Tax=Xanthomonas translucens group TaxID=3390202 RepID=A0A0K2ZJE5_9XANT|nr:heme exporter protein CcmD [Xanthomonas translucens]KWV12967.1 heme transporter CcmD [Xanthomonas translucens]QSQ35384.1 heme exporter protein CcmD [Xanthomonas translucens pv. translucens]QSQ44188.1 heme exporter protein CcmD [Xanthomonas translucens pv. translucens]UKE63670.1 heme exporter protein CcmD [Xanthomonas translucens pv. poae]UKE76151.1 heme exporter protein CcmD [Xanthomonas translucens pv. arrhenatheri]
MNYLPYVIGAYAVFVGVLLADFVLARLQLRGALRAARRRAQRKQQPKPDPAALDLSR